MVAEGVVDGLEVVEVDEQHRADSWPARQTGHGMLGAVGQHIAISQTGEGIVVGALGQVGFSGSTFRYIVEGSRARLATRRARGDDARRGPPSLSTSGQLPFSLRRAPVGQQAVDQRGRRVAMLQHQGVEPPASERGVAIEARQRRPLVVDLERHGLVAQADQRDRNIVIRHPSLVTPWSSSPFNGHTQSVTGALE